MSAPPRRLDLVPAQISRNPSVGTGWLGWPHARERLSEAVGDRRWLAVPLIGAILSRAWALGLLAIVALHRHAPLFGPGGVTSSWDAAWYIRIAAEGYHRAPAHVSSYASQYDYSFFPLWPGVIRVASVLPVAPATLAAIVSPLLFCVAAVAIAAALEPVFGRIVATDGVLLLAFSPAAWTFSMGYSEALFLLLAAVAFLSTSPGKRALAVALAVVTRIAGLPLIAVDGLQWLRSRGRDLGALTVAIAGGIAFAGWWVAIWIISGDPIGFLHGSPNWGASTGIWAVIRALQDPHGSSVAALGVIGLAAIGGIVAFRRSWRMGTYALLTLALALLPGGIVSSMPRYALAAFPSYAGLASLGSRRVTAVMIAASALSQIAFVAWSFTGGAHHLPP